MSHFLYGAPARAATTALLIFLAGAALGVVVDRAWLSRPAVEGMSLTASALADRLGLAPEEEARLSVLLDSLHVEVTAAAANGPEALRAATDRAHRTIAASLPTESRPAFHAWMQEHHEHMMRRLGNGSMARGR
jgi:hypothetical protein